MREIAWIQEALTRAEDELLEREARLEQRLRNELSAEEADREIDALETSIARLSEDEEASADIKEAELVLATLLEEWIKVSNEDCRPLMRADIPELTRPRAIAPWGAPA